MKTGLLSIFLYVFLIFQLSTAFGLPPAFHLAPLVAISLFSLLSAYLQWRLWVVAAWGWAYLVSWLVEYLGVNYGLVFGRYEYSAMLGPEAFGVPLVIPHLWFVVVYISYITAGSRLGAVMLAALWDLAYDPLFAKIGLWSWEGGVVPLTNFLGWLVTAAVISAAFKPTRVTAVERRSYLVFLMAYLPLALRYGVFWSLPVVAVALATAFMLRRLWL